MENNLQPQQAVSEYLPTGEVDKLVATAKAYPRDIAECVKEMTFLATMDAETAEDCFFSLPRGTKKDPVTGKDVPSIVQGESIRLAEIATFSWKNIIVSSRQVEIDRVNKIVKVQAFGWDTERNSFSTMEETRPILYKDGSIYSADMINMTSKAAQSIARRNVIFTIIPKALLKNLFKEIIKKIGEGDNPNITLETRINTAFDYFINLGISEERICKTLQIKNRKNATVDHIVILSGIKTGLKNGDISDVGNAFEPLKKEDATAKSKQAGKEAAAAVASAAAPVPPVESSDDKLRELWGEGSEFEPRSGAKLATVKMMVAKIKHEDIAAVLKEAKLGDYMDKDDFITFATFAEVKLISERLIKKK